MCIFGSVLLLSACEGRWETQVKMMMGRYEHCTESYLDVEYKNT
jgi:hypothetical protein